MSRPNEGPNGALWDQTGRYLQHRRELTDRMLAFWERADHLKREWYSEVTGGYHNTITFTYRRLDAHFGTESEIHRLLRDLELLVGELRWQVVTHHGFIALFARTPEDFCLCVWTGEEKLPASLKEYVRN